MKLSAKISLIWKKKGLLVKSHGGATLKQGAVEHPFQVREKENSTFKQAIARKALDFIPPQQLNDHWHWEF
ncbi:Uncharacterised protein [Klebsiella oxytoca]|nr:Uncharacterised protein [Klebsiella oxytoca]